MKQKRMFLMTILLLGLVSFVSVGAEEITWEFYYVSEKVEPTPPSIWITKTIDGGMGDAITEDNLNQDTEKVLYLHTESNGAEGLIMTLNPLADENNVCIPYIFKFSEIGSTSEEKSSEINNTNKTINLLDWNDPMPVRMRHDFKLSWLPDQNVIATIATGTYTTIFEVEVKTL